MKTAILASLVALLTGCANIKFSETKLDGTKISFSAHMFYDKQSMKGLNVGYDTGKTKKSLGISNTETDVNTEAIKATNDLMVSMIQAAIQAGAAAAKKSVIP